MCYSEYISISRDICIYIDERVMPTIELLMIKGSFQSSQSVGKNAKNVSFETSRKLL